MRIGTMMFALFACGNAHAGAWESLEGRWHGEGTVRGMHAQIELVFRPALESRGRHLAFRNRMRGEDGVHWLFVAEALYRCDDAGACTGHWYDSRGMVLPLSATQHADRVVVEWGDAATERGRTHYVLEADGSLAITDEVRGEDGEWRAFGETRATRR
jgi:hypothetical protein